MGQSLDTRNIHGYRNHITVFGYLIEIVLKENFPMQFSFETDKVRPFLCFDTDKNTFRSACVLWIVVYFWHSVYSLQYRTPFVLMQANRQKIGEFSHPFAIDKVELFVPIFIYLHINSFNIVICLEHLPGPFQCPL